MREHDEESSLESSSGSFPESWIQSEKPVGGKKFLETVGSSEVLEFGQRQESHEWIECESKSIPGKTYFFNLRSRCSTWDRPVSPRVHVPRYRNLSRKYLKEQSDDENHPLMIVSSEEEQLSKSEEAKITKRKNKRILSRLFHIQNNNRENDYRRTGNSGNQYSSDQCSTSTEDSYFDFIFPSATSTPSKAKKNETLAEEGLPFPVTEFLETRFYVMEDKENCYGKKRQVSDSEEQVLASSCQSDSDEIREYYSKPRLKKIAPSDLVRTKTAKRKSVATSKCRRKNNNGIVYEMYGTKTVNYDTVNLDLLDASRISSDDDTYSRASEKHSLTSIDNYLQKHFPNKELMLSEASTDTSDVDARDVPIKSNVLSFDQSCYVSDTSDVHKSN